MESFSKGLTLQDGGVKREGNGGVEADSTLRKAQEFVNELRLTKHVETTRPPKGRVFTAAWSISLDAPSLPYSWPQGVKNLPRKISRL